MLTQSERKSDTCTHVRVHTDIMKPVGFEPVCELSADCLVIISVSGLFHVSA